MEAPKELELPAVVRGIILHVEDLRVDLRTIVYNYKEDVPAEIMAYFDNGTTIHVYMTSKIVFATVTSNKKPITRKAEAKKISLINTWMKKKYNKSCSRTKTIQSLHRDDICEEVKTEISQLLEV